MKNKLILIVVISALALPVMAETSAVLTPTKLYDLIEQLQKRAHGAAERDKLFEKRLKVLEDKIRRWENSELPDTEQLKQGG